MALLDVRRRPARTHETRKGAEGRSNARGMANAPDRGGKLQGRFRRGVWQIYGSRPRCPTAPLCELIGAAKGLATDYRLYAQAGEDNNRQRYTVAQWGREWFVCRNGVAALMEGLEHYVFGGLMTWDAAC
jgi:hypothetical protein